MPQALAVAAHPDDIEFVMAGTLLLLKASGWEIHYMNLSSGDLGSMTQSRLATARTRRAEAQDAARMLGAQWHPPFTDDLQIFYDDRSIRRVAAVVREVQPTVILTHSPQDYMEDHMITARLAVTAAFARGMPNYRTRPARQAYAGPTTVYHACPHGLRDGLRKMILPDAFVDTGSVHAQKRAALACHASQKDWLDKTQGLDSYLVAMDQFSRDLAELSGAFEHAEGWRRHSHLGFCQPDDDPLRDALGADYLIDLDYEQSLEGFP